MKPENPFRKGSLIWAVMEGDWSDLTPSQIGEVLGSSGKSVSNQIIRIRRLTGYRVPHDPGKQRRRGKATKPENGGF